MKSRRALSPVLVGVALILTVTGVGGCNAWNGAGAQSDAEAAERLPNRRAYDEVLLGLKEAALTGKPYDATREVEARDLGVAERAVIHSFCEFAWQIRVNNEAEKLSQYSYLVERLTFNAQFDLSAAYRPAVRGAMEDLRAVIDLASLDGGLVRRYEKGCNRR